MIELLVLAFVLFTHINVSSSNRELETAPPATCKFLFTIETITDVLFMQSQLLRLKVFEY